MNGWGYSPHYQNALEPIRNSVKKVLEVGICGYRDIPNNVVGASLFVWRDFFPHATIYGLDNDGRFIFNDQWRIQTAQCDAYEGNELYNALYGMNLMTNSFEFIVDDAVHDPGPQTKLLCMLWPFLKSGGIYSMEDVCPYKLPNGDLAELIDKFPPDSETTVISTHKAERLLLVRKN